MTVGLLVMAVMILWPARWGKILPGSLAGIVLATLALRCALGWTVNTIGEIPRTIMLAERLRFANIPWDNLGALVAPALSVAALAASSLCCAGQWRPRPRASACTPTRNWWPRAWAT